MVARSRKNLAVIGWREWVALPEIGIARIKAKIDTGARSSSLHAFDVEVINRNESSVVRFKVYPLQKSSNRVVEAEAPLVELRWVKNSGGKEELRPVIRTEVEYAGESWPIEITLARRDVMGFRMLLGRSALHGRFVVDPGRSFLHKRVRKPARRKKKPRPGGDR